MWIFCSGWLLGLIGRGNTIIIFHFLSFCLASVSSSSPHTELFPLPCLGSRIPTCRCVTWTLEIVPHGFFSCSSSFHRLLRRCCTPPRTRLHRLRVNIKVFYWRDLHLSHEELYCQPITWQQGLRFLYQAAFLLNMAVKSSGANGYTYRTYNTLKTAAQGGTSCIFSCPDVHEQ